MATTDRPYYRIGENSWGELLEQVNDVLQNPPSGCDPITPIAIPEECHRWAKSDIQEVHDRLNEMPGSCFEFQPIPDLWEVSIIDDIESQLGNAWCDCDDECCQSCSNAASTPIVLFLGSKTGRIGCVNGNTNPPCLSQTCHIDNCRVLSETIQIELFNRLVILDERCGLEKELNQLEKELIQLEKEKDECDTVECENALESQILLKQQEIDLKSQEVTNKIEEANDKLNTIKSLDASLRSCISSCCGDCGYCDVCLVDELPTTPVMSPGCGDNLCDDYKPCCGGGCSAICSGEWLMAFTENGSRRIVFDGITLAEDGTTILTNFDDEGFSCVLRYCCVCTGAGCAGSCLPDDSESCPDGSGDLCDTFNEWELVVFPPAEHAPFNCRTFEPC